MEAKEHAFSLLADATKRSYIGRLKDLLKDWLKDDPTFQVSAAVISIIRQYNDNLPYRP